MSGPESDAKRLGLVDQLGSFDDAVRSAARHAKLTEYELEFVEPELSWAQELVLQMKSSAVKALLSAGVDDQTAALVRIAHKFDPADPRDGAPGPLHRTQQGLRLLLLRR